MVASLSTLYGRLQDDEHPAMDRLRRDAQGQFVPGVGPVPARIMFLGEAPGAAETRNGRPFCGPAGKVLNEWCQIADISRADCFVTNSVKYQPVNSRGDNRKPWKSELEVHTKYLAAETVLVRPQWIVALGSTALTMLWLDLLGDAPKISDVHGREIPITGRYRASRIFALYHPAAVLHNEDLVDVARMDAQRLGDTLRSTVDA
jgi:DNA polymerase